MVVLFSVAPLLGSAADAQSSASGLDRGPPRLAGDQPSYIDLGVGAFNTQDHRRAHADAEGRIEFRYGEKLLYVGPSIGLLGNKRGGVFGYAGIYADLAFGRVVLTPLGAIGGYRRGDGESLGGTFQFRLSANLAYQFDNESRLGVQFAHISNAGIHRSNAGDDEVLITYGIPLHLPF